MSMSETAPGITPQRWGELRHRCRNPRCRMKLPTPIDNLHRAFCTRGCYERARREDRTLVAWYRSLYAPSHGRGV